MPKVGRIDFGRQQKNGGLTLRGNAPVELGHHRRSGPFDQFQR